MPRVDVQSAGGGSICLGLKAEAIDYSNGMSHGGTRTVCQRHRRLLGMGGVKMPAFFQSV